MMTMTLSSRWLFVCLVPLAACGSAQDDASKAANAAFADTGSGSGNTCSSANENRSISLACPAGQTITSVQFASYGTPNGSCGSFSVGNCHAANTVSIVTAECVGKLSCSVAATNAVFKDPCPLTAKHLAAQVVCSGQTSATASTGATGGASTSASSAASTGGSRGAGPTGRLGAAVSTGVASTRSGATTSGRRGVPAGNGGTTGASRGNSGA